MPARVAKLVAGLAKGRDYQGMHLITNDKQPKCARIVIGDDWLIWCRLADGRFPRWHDVFLLDSPEATLKLGAGDALDLATTAKAQTTKESRGIDFTFDANSLEIVAPGNFVYQTSAVLCDASKPIRACLDPRYLVDVLKTVGAQILTAWDVIDAKNPVVIRWTSSTGASCRYAVMPLSKHD